MVNADDAVGCRRVSFLIRSLYAVDAVVSTPDSEIKYKSWFKYLEEDHDCIVWTLVHNDSRWFPFMVKKRGEEEKWWWWGENCSSLTTLISGYVCCFIQIFQGIIISLHKLLVKHSSQATFHPQATLFHHKVWTENNVRSSGGWSSKSSVTIYSMFG